MPGFRNAFEKKSYDGCAVWNRTGLPACNVRLSPCTKERFDAEPALRLAFCPAPVAQNVGVAVLAILTLALGVGANTAIFTIIDSVLLRPLPYADSARLVYLGS